MVVIKKIDWFIGSFKFSIASWFVCWAMLYSFNQDFVEEEIIQYAVITGMNFGSMFMAICITCFEIVSLLGDWIRRKNDGRK